MSRILKSENKIIRGYEFGNNGTWIKKFSFIQMADTQLGLTNNDEDWNEEIRYTEKCIEVINSLKPLPEFVIVCGDMVNAFPGTKRRKEQVSDFVKVFQKMHPQIPLLCVCGNHDIGNKPNTSTIEIYKNDFGGDYYHFWIKGVKCIVLNSQYLFDSSDCSIEAEEHEKWLNEQLTNKENSNAKHVIVFQHIPWFNTSSDEEDGYFNLPNKIRKLWMDKFIANGIKKVYAGHLHKNCGGIYKNEKGETLEVIVTTAVGMQLGDDNHGFQIVSVEENNIDQKFISVFLS